MQGQLLGARNAVCQLCLGLFLQATPSMLVYPKREHYSQGPRLENEKGVNSGGSSHLAFLQLRVTTCTCTKLRPDLVLLEVEDVPPHAPLCIYVGYLVARWKAFHLGEEGGVFWPSPRKRTYNKDLPFDGRNALPYRI